MMKSQFLLPILLISFSLAGIIIDDEVAYSCVGKNNCLDPSQWYKKTGYATCNPSTSQQQSPRNIISSKTIDREIFTINSKSNSFEVTAMLQNNGHSVDQSIEDKKNEKVPQIEVGCNNTVNNKLKCKQQFNSLHFHWDNRKREFRGSEHTLNNKYQPLEMHMIHIDHINHKYAVIGIFFDVYQDKSSPKNKQLQKIANLLNSNIAKKDRFLSKNSTHEFSAALKLNPYDIWQQGKTEANFVQQTGSLTTPPCTEGLLWLVKEVPIKIDINILEEFQKVRFNSHDTDTFNWRPQTKLVNKSPFLQVKWKKGFKRDTIRRKNKYISGFLKPIN